MSLSEMILSWFLDKKLEELRVSIESSIVESEKRIVERCEQKISFNYAIGLPVNK